MIKLSYEQYCDGCKYFDPEANISVLDIGPADMTTTVVETKISCKSRNKCARMYENLKRRVEKYDRSKAE